MDTTTTGRYRMLASDMDAVRTDGERAGSRCALDDARNHADYNDHVPFHMIGHHAHNAAHQLGLDWDALSSDAKSVLSMAWSDGFRDGYAESWPEDD